MKQRNSIIAILCISTLLFTMSAFGGIAYTEDSSESMQVKHSYRKANIMPTAINQQPVEKAFIQSPTIAPIPSYDADVQITTGEGFDIQPTIANDDSGNLVLGYLGDPSGTGEYNVWFSSSLDQGASWPPENSVALDVPTPEKPSIDHWGGGRFVATMVPSTGDYDGSALYILQFYDPAAIYDTLDAVYWTWSDVGEGYKNFKDVSMACDNAVEEYAWGGVSIIGNHGSNSTDVPMFSYQATEDGTAWIYEFSDAENDTFYENCQSTSTDIDPITHESYSVWNYLNETTGVHDILLYKFDFATWDTYEGYPIHPGIGEIFISSASDHLNIDVSSQNNNTLVVAETGDEVICYYSNDGMQTMEMSSIAGEGATYPKIVHTDNNKAVCLFTRDNNVYTSITEDGGQTWGPAVQLNDEDGSVTEDESMTDICKIGAVWTDDRTGDQNIFFDVPGVAVPLVKIESIAGGFGISATVVNDGTADAENLPWSITLDGGLILLGGETTGEIPVLAAGSSETISTGLIFGFGNTAITVTVGGAQKEASSTVLLFFALGVE